MKNAIFFEKILTSGNSLSRKLNLASFLMIGLVMSGSASAQTAIGGGVMLSTGTQTQTNYYQLDLGTSATSSSMPLSLRYAGVNIDVSFTGGSAVQAAAAGQWNPTPGQNYIDARGTATFQFSSAQSYFGFAWSSPDTDNLLSFYNGSQLVTSITGQTFRTIAGVSRTSLGSYAEFTFSGGA